MIFTYELIMNWQRKYTEISDYLLQITYYNFVFLSPVKKMNNLLLSPDRTQLYPFDKQIMKFSLTTSLQQLASPTTKNVTLIHLVIIHWLPPQRVYITIVSGQSSSALIRIENNRHVSRSVVGLSVNTLRIVGDRGRWCRRWRHMVIHRIGVVISQIVLDTMHICSCIHVL